MKKSAPPNDPGTTAEARTGETPQGRRDGGGFAVLLKYALKIGVTAGIVAVLVHTSRKHGTFDGLDFGELNWAWLAAAFGMSFTGMSITTIMSTITNTIMTTIMSITMSMTMITAAMNTTITTPRWETSSA